MGVLDPFTWNDVFVSFLPVKSECCGLYASNVPGTLLFIDVELWPGTLWFFDVKLWPGTL